MNAIAYYRVSTDLQDYNRQIQDIKTYCTKEGIEVIKEFAEKESGKKKVRPELTEMINFCLVSKPDFVIISELSRLGRTSEVLNTIEILNNNKTCLVSLKENIRTLNPDLTINAGAGLLTSILSGINSYELSTLNYRIKSGKLSSAIKGKHGGGKNLPYGYKKENKMLVINSNEKPIVEDIFKLYLNGFGILKIAQYLSSKGYKTRNGKEWNVSTVQNILRNPLTTGKRLYKDVEISIPSIISIEDFNKVQKIIKSKEHLKAINVKHDYLLNLGLIKCGSCGGDYYGKRYVNANNANTYCCSTNRYGKRKCENLGINIDKLEKSVTNILTYFFPYQLTKNVDLSGLNQEIEVCNDFIRNNELKQINLIKDEQGLIDLSLQGFDINIIKTRLEDLRKTQSKLKADSEKLVNKIEDLQKQVLNKSNYKTIAKEIEENGISKELLHKIITKIIITPAEHQINNKINDKTLKVDIYINDFLFSFYTTQRKDDNRLVIADFSESIEVYNETGDYTFLERGQEIEIDTFKF